MAGAAPPPRRVPIRVLLVRRGRTVRTIRIVRRGGVERSCVCVRLCVSLLLRVVVVDGVRRGPAVGMRVCVVMGLL